MQGLGKIKSLLILSSHLRQFVNGSRATSAFYINASATKHSSTLVKNEGSSKKLCLNNLDSGLIHRQIQRSKSSKRGRKATKEDTDDSDDEDEEDDVVESIDDVEPDYEAPLNYKHVQVNTLRADGIVAKALMLSNAETERLFYESRFLFRGKKLLKKATRLDVGDSIDIIQDELEGKQIQVQRVKVIIVSNQQSKDGKPKLTVRVWKKPFVIDNPCQSDNPV